MSDLKKQIAALDRDRARLAIAAPQVPPPLRDEAYVPRVAAPREAGPRVGSRTPWGAADHVEKLADGIWQVGTPGHGGIKLSAARNKTVPDYMRAKNGWYEEDCEWAVAATVFPGAFKPTSREHAKKTLKNWKPDAYEKFYGVSLAPGESHVLDERTWRVKHAGDWVSISWVEGAPEGHLIVVTTPGGRYPRYGESIQKRKFVVSNAEYAARGKYGLVVDPARHQEVT